MLSSGGVTPRGFKHFATQPTHPSPAYDVLSSDTKMPRA
jgi:hypothetical protein